MQQEKNITINVSTGTILKLIGIFLLLGFLFVIRDVVIVFFISFVIASALTPAVNYFQERKIPRFVSTVVIYVLFFGFLVLIVSLIISPLSSQIKELANNFPMYYSKISSQFGGLNGQGEEDLNSLQDILASSGQYLSQFAGNIFTGTINIFGGLVSTIIIIVLSFYLVLEDRGAKKFISEIVPLPHKYKAVFLQDAIQKRLGRWFRGQIILCFIIGLITFIGLSVMGVRYALLLALIAGFLEVIPFIGPVLASIPAIFFAFLQSPVLALVVAIFYFVVQEAENHLIVPQVMKKMTGLNPIFIMLALMIGARLAGVSGMVLAVPFAVAIEVVARDFWETRPKDGKLGDLDKGE